MRLVAKMYLSAKSLFTKKEEGASLAEYGLLLALIAVVCIAAIETLGGGIRDMFTAIGGHFSGGTPTP